MEGLETLGRLAAHELERNAHEVCGRLEARQAPRLLEPGFRLQACLEFQRARAGSRAPRHGAKDSLRGAPPPAPRGPQGSPAPDRPPAWARSFGSSGTPAPPGGRAAPRAMTRWRGRGPGDPPRGPDDAGRFPAGARRERCEREAPMGIVKRRDTGPPATAGERSDVELVEGIGRFPLPERAWVSRCWWGITRASVGFARWRR